MKKQLLPCFTVLFFIAIGLPKGNAQSIFGVHFNVAQPIGEYAKYVPNAPLGLSFNYFKPIKKVKGLYVGAELGVGMFYKDTYDLAKADELGFFEVEEEDCYLTYHAAARYFLPNKSFLTPYAEIRIGGISYFSSLYADDAEENGFKNETKFHGTAFNAGIGAGLMAKLSSQLSLDSSVSISKGSKTHYRSIDNKADRIRLDLEEGEQVSSTDFVNFKLGILFGF